MKKIVTSLLVLALSTGAALAADKSISADEKKFMDLAARAGKLEVKLGKLAEKNAKASSVKKFGSEMVHDHEKASAELKDLAAKKSVTLPGSIDEKQQSLDEKLSKTAGADFDSSYMKHMVEDHEKVVQAFRDRSKASGDADLTSWVKKTLPTLEHHLVMAKDVDKEIKQK